MGGRFLAALTVLVGAAVPLSGTAPTTTAAVRASAGGATIVPAPALVGSAGVVPAGGVPAEARNDPGAVGVSDRSEADASGPRGNGRDRGRDRQGCPEHPYPCGDEWPEGVAGPFELDRVVRVEVPMDDGVVLDGWVGMPDVPEGVQVPVALHSSPYLSFCTANVYWGGGCAGGPEDDAWWSDPPGETGAPPHPDAIRTWGVAPIDLVKRGIAAAFVSVRGTGNSGGCLDLWGPRERRDQEQLVEWFGDQTWSNGRVGMGGLSHPGTTPLMAAVEAPQALKTIIVGGIISDVYLFLATPQGAKAGHGHSFTMGQATSISLLPPLGSGVEHGLAGRPDLLLDRACPEFAELYTKDLRELFSDDRRADYYEPRRLIDDFEDVTTSVLVAHGLRDDTAHAFQDGELWRTMMRAPKRLIQGQWGHVLPIDGFGELDASWEADTWEQLVFDWLDYWLWGKGDPPERLDSVAYQDHLGAWRESSAWPPAEARDEVLYLSGQGLAPEQDGTSRSYRSAPNPLNSYRGTSFIGSPWRPWDALCPTPATSAAGNSGLVYTTEALQQPVTIAGNPHAYLRLTSDLPGGIVTVKLVDIGPDFSCDAAGQPSGVRYLASGGADLRFHRGTFQGSGFPTGTPTQVRIDIFDLAETIQPGHRLAMEVSYGESHIEWTGQPYLSQITVHADADDLASHVVLPIVNGTLGGQAPTLDYPPRPFVPRE